MADGYCRLHSPATDTKANSRKSAARSAQLRRERGRSLAELVRERVEADAETLYRQLRAAIDHGDRDACLDFVDKALGYTPRPGDAPGRGRRVLGTHGQAARMM